MSTALKTGPSYFCPTSGDTFPNPGKCPECGDELALVSDVADQGRGTEPLEHTALSIESITVGEVMGLASPSETLAEAMRIVRGETAMLARKPHLLALAELNAELMQVIQFAHDRLDGMTTQDFSWGGDRQIRRLLLSAITKFEAVSHA